MKPNKAILIDVFNRTITETIVNGLGDLQKAVGGYIETATRDEKNGKEVDVFVDEEGLFKYNHFFEYRGAHQPFAGNGIVVGANAAGETIDCPMTINEVKAKVRFLSRIDVLNQPE